MAAISDFIVQKETSSKQPTVKRSKRQQSFFAGKAYLKNKLTCKTPLHEFIAVARSGLWAPGRIETTALGVGVRVKEAGGGEGRNMSNIF